MNAPISLWVGFHVFVLAILAMDLGLFHRKDHAVSPKEAGIWTGVWVTLSLLFCAGIWHFAGRTPALQWVTAYVVEYSLSIDNLFVFLMVFGFFRVAPEVQHRVLFWGIIGAFVMRAVLIIAGTSLVQRFHWLIYLFGAFLVFTAVKMMVSKDDEAADPEQGFVVKLARRVLPVARQDQGNHFFTIEDGRRKVTPLFIVLLVVEATDLLFALDSIPAVLGISQDAFVVYTSNVCAILGLRSLFFVVASLMDKFHLLKVGLSVILAFVGVKMLITYFDIHVPIGISLGVIGGVLVLSVVASLIWPKAPEPEAARTEEERERVKP
ncbi:TerC family protein [Myxococcaceae bacterium GXIMD 01537]